MSFSNRDITAGFLAVEAQFNRLAMRLADHGRPAFQPAQELSIAGLNGSLRQLAIAEGERDKALHAELNRQV
jgi:hypothetical protein